MMITRLARNGAPPAFRARNRASAWLSIFNLVLFLNIPATVALAQPSQAAAGQGVRVIAREKLYSRENLIAWCIVPFDSKKRTPEERAAMLQRLGFKHFAYDWRAEHIPTFDAEIEALERHGISLDAFWVAPGELNRESRLILDVLKRHGKKVQLWVLLDLGPDQRHRRPSRSDVSKRPPPRSARWPRKRPGSAARWHSTTTAAGSASRKTRSRSSSD